MKRATVVANEHLGGDFHLITLEGVALRGVVWLPGHKVQIAMGLAFVTRTYTPIEWDLSTGRTRILGYSHGDGPGSIWVRTAEPGDECEIFGPRASVDLTRLGGPLVIVGDETSIGLAYAATHQDRTRLVSSRFEVEDVGAARQAAVRLGLQNVIFATKNRYLAHSSALEAALSDDVAAGATFALTGSAPTIQRIRRSLKEHSVPTARLFTKAYWSPGTTGLD